MPSKSSQSSVRIIGGKWRSRKISFEDAPGLRPTHDRVRETLFNWLQHDIVGANCLDLFAGTGALGFEALSRGAEYVAFVDISKIAIKHLKNNIENLKADNATVYNFDFAKTSELPFNKPFDIIFLDPPFQQNLVLPALSWIKANNLVHTNTLIYLETEFGALDTDQLSDSWYIFRHEKTKTLEFFLLESVRV